MSDSFLPPVMVELGGTADAFLKTLTKAVNALERFAAAARTAGETTEAAFATIEASSAPLASMAESVGAVKTELQGLSRASNAVAKATDKAAVSIETGMASIAGSAERMAAAVDTATAAADTGIAGLGAGAKTTAAGLKTASTEAAVAGTSMTRAGEQAEATGSKFLGLGSVFDKVKKWGAIGLAGIGIAAVDLASKFQTQMTRLSTAAGAPIKQVDAMKGAVLSTASAVNMSGTQMAEALYHPVSAGLDLKASLQAVKYAAEEAQISGASLDDTTYSLSSVMKAFNYSAAQAGPTMAQLNAIVGQGDMRFQDFNESVKNWAPTAAQMGISVNSMGSGLAYLTDRGNSAEVAATRLTMGISMMTTPSKKATDMLVSMGDASTDVSASSKAMKSAMEDAGITQNRLAADLKKPDGLYVALNDLKTSLHKAGVSGTEADSVLSKIFGGGRSDKAIMSLMQNLDGLKTKFGDISKASTMKNFDASWEKTQQTFSQQMKKIKTSAESLGISLGTVLLPGVTKIADAFGKAVSAIAPFVSQHKQLIGFVAAVAGGMLLAAGAIKTVTLATKLWAAAQGFVDAAMGVFDAEEAMTGIPELIILIAALVAGVIYAWEHFSTFREVVMAVFHAVIAAGVALWHALEAAWGGIVAAADAVGHALKTAWNGVVAGVAALRNSMQSAWNAITSVTTRVWNGIIGFFRKWWPLLLVLFMPEIAAIIAIWNHFHSQITGTAHAVWNAIAAFFTTIWGGIAAAARVVWAVIKAGIIAPMVSVWHQLQSLWHTIAGWLSSAWRAIAGVASSIWGSIRDRMTGPLTSAWHTITSIIGKIKSAISSGLNAAYNAVKGIGGKFVQIGAAIVQGIVRGVENSGGALKNELGNLANSALSSAKSYLGINSPSRAFADQVGQWIPAGIAQGVVANGDAATRAVKSLSAGLPAAAVSAAASGTHLTSSMGRGGGSTLAGANAGTVVNNTIVVNVAGHVLTEKQLGDVIEQQFLRKGMRRSTTYQNYKRG